MDRQIERAASRGAPFSNQLTEASAKTGTAAYRCSIEMNARPFSHAFEHGHFIKNLTDKHGHSNPRAEPRYCMGRDLIPCALLSTVRDIRMNRPPPATEQARRTHGRTVAIVRMRQHAAFPIAGSRAECRGALFPNRLIRSRRSPDARQSSVRARLLSAGQRDLSGPYAR